MPSFKYWDEVWQEESGFREAIDPSKICTFGIKPLDDLLVGILNNDLIVVGADSGVGKSHMALDIAIHNAINGKIVALFFIEGGAQEAIVRIKWKLICKLYYEKYKCGMDLDYRMWRMNMSERPALLKTIEDEAFEIFRSQVKDRLHIFDFEKGFTITDLKTSLGWFMPKESFLKYTDQPMYNVNLIIIDHLQYFTLTNAKNEYTEMTDILMAVKDITNYDRIPVVLISHLRKKDKERGLPNQEDFFGTSNIAKISSIAITIAPSQDQENHTTGIYPTYFRVVKSRTGARSTLAMLSNFNSKLGEYEKDYKVCKISFDKPVGELVGIERPHWSLRKEEVHARYKKPDVTARLLGEHGQEDIMDSKSIPSGDNKPDIKEIVWDE